MLKQRLMPPARTIDETAIKNAFVEANTYEKTRIELYKEVGSMKERATLRRRAGLTQVQLANLVNCPGVTAPRICLWERHELEFRPEQVAQIAAVINEHLGQTPVFDGANELARVLAPSLVAIEAA